MKILILIFLLIPSLIIAKERLLVCKNFFGDGGEVIFKHKDSLIKKDEIFIRRSTGVWQNVKNYLEEDVFGIYTNVEIIKYEISKDGGYAEFFHTKTDKSREYYSWGFDFKFNKLRETKINLDSEGGTIEKGKRGFDSDLPKTKEYNCQKLKK